VLEKAYAEMAKRNLRIGMGLDTAAPIFDDFAVSGRVGQLLTAAIVSDHFRRRVAKLDIPRIRFHDLRHCHASRLLANKEALTAVSERLGHASPNVTLGVYSHAIKGADQDMMARYDETHLSIA
jgi:integrase